MDSKGGLFWWNMLGLMLLTMAFIFPHQAAAENRKAVLPPEMELPIQVRLGMHLVDISHIHETSHETTAVIEWMIRWKDRRESFDAIERGTSRNDYVEESAVARLASMWTPGVVVENIAGAPINRSVALSIYASGEVVLIRRMEANFRIPVDMGAFPFDRQHLSFAFMTPTYASDDVVLITTELDRQLSTAEQKLSTVNWQAQAHPDFTQEQFYGWNAKPFSRIVATVTVERKFQRYILRIFVPFIAAVLFSSLFLLWAPESALSQKASVIFSSLLALAALSFAYESNFPGSISMNSPIAFMISVGYFYLPGVLATSVLLTNTKFAFADRYPYLIPEIKRNVRWTLPLTMMIICVASVLRAL